MSTTVTVGGVNYAVPSVGESNWGQNVSDLLIAIAANISGGGFFTVVAVSSSPITGVSGRTYLVDTSSARQINLPAPALNAYIIIRDKDGTSETNNITIHRNGGEKINGVASDYACDVAYGTWWLFSDGTDWYSILLPQIRDKQSLTEAQRDAITNWKEGDEIYNMDKHRPEFYDGITWMTL